MDIKYNPKPLTCVEYPGTVMNVENMEKTLGGFDNLCNTFKNPSKRLELRFRPGDPFCKCAHGDRFTSTNIVLKVIKRTKRKGKNTDLNSEPEPQYSVECVGVVSTTYKFKSLCDFQVLPVSFDKTTNEYKSLLSSIVPTTLHSASWLNEEVDLFVPPMLFSRFDLPQSAYAESQTKIDEDNANLPPNIIGRGRKKRAGGARFITFDIAEVPKEPKPEAIRRRHKYALDIEIGNRVGAVFKDRPIWSRNALLYKLRCDKSRLKYHLPCQSYFYFNGPWRTLWVRFGYDPRKDPAAKHWQTMDIRMHPNIPLNEKRPKTRTFYYNLPNKLSQNQSRIAVIDPNYLIPNAKKSKPDEEELMAMRLAAEYVPGHLPVFRQSFYQICDIHIPEVQELVHRNDGQEKECTITDGWLEPGTLDKIREIVLADVWKTVQSLEDKNEDDFMEEV